jgi:hypothetical protein
MNGEMEHCINIGDVRFPDARVSDENDLGKGYLNPICLELMQGLYLEEIVVVAAFSHDGFRDEWCCNGSEEKSV